MPGPDGTPGTGMLKTELVQRAQRFWDTYGRFSMVRDFHLRTPPNTVRRSENAPMTVVKHSPEEDLPESGILRGAPWDELTVDDQERVCRAWYASWCANERGELSGERPLDRLAHSGGSTIQRKLFDPKTGEMKK